MTPDGWLEWAERMPGPADKKYTEGNAATGYIAHSAVGYLHGWLSRLYSLDRGADGRYTPNAAASVHGWIAYDGHVIQHYPMTASCWASGSRYPNTHFIAFENEGGHAPHDEPLTPAQVAANVRIIRELAQWKQWPAITRPGSALAVDAQLWEHRECNRFGSAPTACPSDRIPWDRILADLEPKPPIGELSPPDPGQVDTSLVWAAARYRMGNLQYLMSHDWDVLEYLVSKRPRP